MSKAVVRIADRNNETKARRESGVPHTFHQRLEAIIQPDVFKAVLIFHKRMRDCVGELVLLTENWPFLSEACGAFLLTSLRRYKQIQDVLNNTGFLIVSFFHQEGIVLDPFGQRFH